MIDVANKWDEGDENALVKVIANHMKKVPFKLEQRHR
jgi:hypothetical protein